MMGLLEPKEVEVNGKRFIISKFPAVAGREITTQYLVSGTPKIGDYKRNEELMLKLMSFVAVPLEAGGELRLTTQALIDNHMGPKGWETLIELEKEVMFYNCSFLADGRASNFFDGIAQAVTKWATQMLTGLSAVSSNPEKQPLTN